MNILCIGDVCGSSGCDALRKFLPKFKNDNNIDLTIVNGENSYDKNGIVKRSCEHIICSGADIVTTGNHVFRHKDIYEILDNSDCVIRPANYTSNAHGQGYTVCDLGRVRVGVVNLLGNLFMNTPINPFSIIDGIIEKLRDDGVHIIVVDFHAEATGEKRALGYYLDGRISALFGTHTHVQTADAQILPNGTGYITDVGMTGPCKSVLGMDIDVALTKVKDMLPSPFCFASGKSSVCGAVFDIDEKSGICRSVRSFCENIN